MSDRETGNGLKLTDAGELHEKGYTTRAVHACWVLEAYAVLHGHLTNGGEPIKDDHGIVADSSYYLSAAEWREVRAAARVIVDLSPIIAFRLDSEERP